MARLTGKTAIITGATGGIGLAAARCFVAEGANVVLVDLDEASLKTAADELGSKAAYLAADVTAPDTATPTWHARRKNSAASTAPCSTRGSKAGSCASPTCRWRSTTASWQSTSAPCGSPRRTDAGHEGGGGSIVITSSVAGLRGSPGLAAYCTSKHAVIGMMKTAALEGAPDRIRVNNTVNPGADRHPHDDGDRTGPLTQRSAERP